MSIKISQVYRVYHYRPDKQPRDVSTLIAKQLYSCAINRLNDPFEFVALRELTNLPDKKAEHQNAGVTCFCRSLTNPLLWSHYAGSHKGFAIGYDATHSFFGGDKGFQDRFLLDVRYEDVVPSLDWFSADELPMAAVLTKPTCWAYEQEVRLIMEKGNKTLNVPVETIKEIIFGVKMLPTRREEIISAVRAAGINAEFAQMQYLDDGYGVKPRWITL
jgi:Protein of unknown function (DUF2971)